MLSGRLSGKIGFAYFMDIVFMETKEYVKLDQV